MLSIPSFLAGLALIFCIAQLSEFIVIVPLIALKLVLRYGRNEMVKMLSLLSFLNADSKTNIYLFLLPRLMGLTYFFSSMLTKSS